MNLRDSLRVDKRVVGRCGHPRFGMSEYTRGEGDRNSPLRLNYLKRFRWPRKGPFSFGGCSAIAGGLLGPCESRED